MRENKRADIGFPVVFPQPVSCSPCRQSVAAFRRSALCCVLKNKILSVNIRRKGALCKASVLPSGRRGRTLWKPSRNRRLASKASMQRCALRTRPCCRNRSSWRRTSRGQSTASFVFAALRTTCLSAWALAHWLLCYFVFCSLRSQNSELSESAKALEISQQELEKRLEALQLQHQQDSTNMQAQLDEADSHSKNLQREVDSDCFMTISSLMFT